MARHQLIALSGVQLKETVVEVDDTTGLLSTPVTTPVDPDHLASKAYVDQLVLSTVTGTGLEPTRVIGSLDFTTATAPGASAGNIYVSTTPGTVGAGYGALTGQPTVAGDMIIFDGSDWVKLNVTAPAIPTVDLDGGTY